ncbi:MAG: GNAT family N-acetyltransferase [Verrucomicrobia bacterium]|jgi:ribosomal protein S18 acetylase RimI-like enzyme|nr:GNAT family N-acetyltransferase [Verrucomicrobiota bacterium]
MNPTITHITLDDVRNGFQKGFYCCMSGVCKRQFQSNMWIRVHEEVGSIGLLARGDKGIVAQTIFLPKNHARWIGLPTALGDPDEFSSTMSISCLLVHDWCRNKGIASKMIQETIDFSRKHGFKRIEAYVDPKSPEDAFQWLPSFSPFKKFGFAVDGSRVAWESWQESRMCHLDL